MADLSPAAQAVLDAAGSSEPGIYATVIATLESLADQVVPSEPELSREEANDLMFWGKWWQRRRTRSRILAIAAELRDQFTKQED